MSRRSPRSSAVDAAQPPSRENRHRAANATPNALTWIAALIALALSIQTVALASEAPLTKREGVYTVPVKINGAISLDFVVDSGAAEVNIPADVALTLVRAHTIGDADFLPGGTYVLGDGTEVRSPRFSAGGPP